MHPAHALRTLVRPAVWRVTPHRNVFSQPTRDTIFALATATGRAAVSVFRVSGERAQTVYQVLTCRHDVPRARSAVVRMLRDPSTGNPLDEALLLFFGGPRSFTGEDVLEIHTHGSVAVQRALVRALSSVDGLRMALPGEFAKRAFENGRLGATQVEGLADLVNAESEAQRIQALHQMQGLHGPVFQEWTDSLVACLASLEAHLDFGEDEDVGPVWDSVRSRIASTSRSIAEHLNDGNRGQITRDGVQLALVGPPNVGKSSILNMLARENVAIVADEAGTTRDLVHSHLEIGGHAVRVADTAGIRSLGEAGTIEREGIRRAKNALQGAHVRVLVVDATAPSQSETDSLVAQCDVHVVNKADIASRAQVDAAVAHLASLGARAPIVISCATLSNVEAFRSKLEDVVRSAAGKVTSEETPLVTRARHRHLLQRTRAALDTCLAHKDDADLAAEDVRQAIRALQELTGRVDIEEVLDQLFSEFCIGK